MYQIMMKKNSVWCLVGETEGIKLALQWAKLMGKEGKATKITRQSLFGKEIVIYEDGCIC